MFRLPRGRGAVSSQLPWLMVIEALTVASFILTVIILSTGSTSGLRPYNILTFDTSAVRAAISPNGSAPDTPVRDWYDAYYTVVCFGLWNTPGAGLAAGMSAGRNHSTVQCVAESLDWTISLSNVLSSTDPHMVGLNVGSDPASARSLNTTASAVLVVLSITLLSISLWDYLYSIIVMVRNPNSERPPIAFLRFAFFAGIAAPICLTISSARMTVHARNMTGTMGVKIISDPNPGLATVTVSMPGAFYALTWVATGLAWVAVGLSIATSFRIAHGLEREKQRGQVATG